MSPCRADNRRDHAIGAAGILLGLLQILFLAQPSSAADSPPPHLGYGVDLSIHENLSAVQAMGFDWATIFWLDRPAPSGVSLLYRQAVHAWTDPGQLQSQMYAIALAQRGIIQAYEIGNEPNTDGEWGAAPDPAAYTTLLRAAYQGVKAADPGAKVVSAGLAPVGRIQGTCGPWQNNNCHAMDDYTYTQEMINAGAAGFMDAFGYHPYGFAYPPETDPNSVPNGFAFRGAETIRSILIGRGVDRPLWATEFGWLLDPGYYGAGYCTSDPRWSGRTWQMVSPQQQADYLVRAYQWADEHWPWMGPMMTFNLDFAETRDFCDPMSWYAVRDANGNPRPAYTALAQMPKNSAYGSPVMVVSPSSLTFLAQAGQAWTQTQMVYITNEGGGTFTWTATANSGQVVPVLNPMSGQAGQPIAVTVNSANRPVGTYTGSFTITAPGAQGSPVTVPITLRVVSQVRRIYAPVVRR